ncbi:hypothetical protein N7535_005215 [Penicillium sp. DV-2018c]|nr:hypothetical protein N7461_008795 [Penicillium sp. DV-2018c]KAJ5571555.1 hypothetical protein N7535_005215 [Penicillium sp. DV-2018c]
MLFIPFIGFFLGMTLWSQWFPIPGLTVPEMSFKQRLAGTLRLTLESWIVCDAEDAHKSQRSHSGGTHFGGAAIVSFADGHGYANTTDYLVISPETAVIVRPGLVDSMPPWFPTGFKVPLPDLSWYSVGVTSSVPEEVVDIHPLGSGPGQGLFVSVLLVVLWCAIQGPMVLAEWTLDYLEGQPQITHVQIVAEKDSTLYDRLDLLIAGVMDIQEETFAWVLATDSYPDSVSHVSVLSHSGGIWVHRIPRSSDREQARDRRSARDTTETGNSTGSACFKLVCQHPWNLPKMDASEHDDDASPSGETRNAKGADIEGKETSLERVLKASEKELEQPLPRPTVPASSAQGSPLATSSNPTPLSALAPVFLPAHPAEQELHSGPLSPAPSEDCANARDFQAPVAAFDDEEEGEYKLYSKFNNTIFSARQNHTSFDVVAWHGNYYPYKYDLGRFNTIGSISQ